MEDNDFTYLLARINQEGFDYCFRKYSNFKEFDDADFHKLRLEYIKAADRLEAYVNEKARDEFFGE
jgi:hypothetical protein